MTADVRRSGFAEDAAGIAATRFDTYAPLGVAHWRLLRDAASGATEFMGSDEFRLLLGWPKGTHVTLEALGRKIHPEDRRRAQRAFFLAINDPAKAAELAVDCRLQHADGSWHWYRTLGRYAEKTTGDARPFFGLTVIVDEEQLLEAAFSEETRSLASAALQQRKALQEMQQLRSRQLETIEKIRALNDELEKGRLALTEQMNVIGGLSREYLTVWLVRGADRRLKLFRSNAADDIIPMVEKFADIETFDKAIEVYAAEFVHPDDREAFLAVCQPSAVIEALAQQPVLRHRHRRVLNGRLNHLEICFAPLAELSGGFVAALRNVDEDVRREEHRKTALETALETAARASSAKTVFLNSVSHDIRTPLNGILGMADIARRNTDNPVRVADCLAKISSASSHLLSLLNEVLDVSRIETGEISLTEEPFRLTEAFSTALSLIAPQARSAGIRLMSVVNGVSHEMVRGDALRLRQVFVNILGNAVKFTPAGGRIAACLSESPTDSRHYSQYVFSCRDTGCGMTQAFLSRIFRPFERSEEASRLGIPGTGLGMSITKNIIETMDGDLKVESVPGAGSTFTATFRLKREESAPLQDAALRGRSALLLGRSNSTGRSLQRILAGIGLDCCCTADVSEACRELSQSRRHCLAFVDLFSDGNGPYASAGCLREAAGWPIPLILVGEHEMTETENQAIADGYSACVTLPLYRSKLESLMKSLLSERVGQSEAFSPLTAFEEQDFSNRRLLLAEDNELNREIALEILQITRVTVDVARNGREAADLFIAAPAGTYNLILMDIQMPVMDGLAASRAIRSSGKPDAATVPIVAVTANAFKEDRTTALSAGMNDYLAKPLDFAALLNVMQRYLGC